MPDRKLSLPSPDDFEKIMEGVREACRRDLSPEEVESFAYHPSGSHHEPYNPSPGDLSEYTAWSQSVDDHDEAMATWMDFFGDAEEKSTFYTA